MKFAGSVLLIFALLLMVFVGLPMKWKLGNQLGHADLYRKAKAARKAGNRQAKRLFVIGWIIVGMYTLGTFLLRFD
jgi:hypothetical protein